MISPYPIIFKNQALQPFDCMLEYDLIIYESASFTGTFYLINFYYFILNQYILFDFLLTRM